MKHARASALIALVVFAAGSFVGCAAASPPDSGPSPRETATATPSPTADPRVEDPADPGTWIVDGSGVGPIEIGGDFATTLTGLVGTWSNDPASCSWSAWWTAPDSAYGMFFVRGAESDSAPIREISVYTTAESSDASPGPQTEDGLGIGATKAAVLAAYPGAQEGSSTMGSDTWIKLPGDTDAHVFFAFRENSDTAWDIRVTTGSEPSYEVCG